LLAAVLPLYDQSVVALPGYVLSRAIASGGMGTVHVAYRADAAFGPDPRPVAVKRMHSHLAGQPNQRAMFLDEAWLAQHIRHPNIVQMHDVVEHGGELFIVMEYVHGESLSRLMQAHDVPRDVACAILCDVLRGLHACHEARDTSGSALTPVHRDVSPQNVLVGIDGTSRLIDFGIAKFAKQLHHTTEGNVRGKLHYLAPEQILGKNPTAKTDLFAVGVLAFELFAGVNPYASLVGDDLLTAVAAAKIPPLADVATDVPPAAISVVMQALSRSPSKRPASAAAFAEALAQAIPPASNERIAKWIGEAANGTLAERTSVLGALKADCVSTLIDATPPHGVMRARFVPGLAAAAMLAFAAALGTVVATRTKTVSAATPPLAPTAAEDESSEVGAETSTATPLPPAATASPRLHRASKAAPSHATPVAPPVAPTSSCDPPYTLDEKLHKKYKPECLRGH
jgi:eukaryotic-like serine/threonine-protein kinase